MSDPRSTLILAAKDLASREVGHLHAALSKIHGVSARAGAGLKSAAGHIAALGKAALLGAAAIGVALVTAILGATKAAADEQVGIGRLGVALKNNVKGFDGNTAAIEKVIAAREKLGFSDDALRDSLGALVTRTKNIAKAQNLQAIAMNLARAKNIDLATATGIVGKVYSGNVGILARYGISVKKGASSTEALAAIQKQTAGQAAKFGDTEVGIGEAIKNTFGDVVEDLGGLFLPMLKTVLTFVRDRVVPGFSAIVGKVREWIANNQPLIAQIGGTLSTVIRNVAGFIADVIPHIVAFGGRLFDMARGILGFVVPKVRAFITTLVGKGGVFDSVGKVVGPIVKDLIPKLATLAEKFFAVVGKVGDLVAIMWGDGKGPLAIAVQALGGLLGWLADNVAGPVLDFLDDFFFGIGAIIRQVKILLGIGSDSRLNNILPKTKKDTSSSSGNKGTSATPNATGGLLLPGGGLYSVGERPGRREDVVVGPGGAMVYSGQSGRGGGSQDGIPLRVYGMTERELLDKVDRGLYFRLSRASPSAGRK